MVLIDTNIFLEVFLDQDKSEDCLKLIEKVESGDIKAFITDFSVHSIGIIISKEKGNSLLPEIFSSLSSFEGLSLINATLEEQISIAVLANQTKLDFDDAYQLYFCKKYNVPIVSFDKDFDDFVEKKDPGSIV